MEPSEDKVVQVLMNRLHELDEHYDSCHSLDCDDCWAALREYVAVYARLGDYGVDGEDRYQ